MITYLTLIKITIATYICMTLYSAAIGWTIGAGIEKQTDIDQETKTRMAATSAAFMIGQAKYVLMLAPSIFVAWLMAPEYPILFLYAYSSTMLMHLGIAFTVRSLKKN